MQFVKEHSGGRSQCILHVFGLTEFDKLLYRQVDSEEIKSISLERIEHMIKAIEADVNFPVLPCVRACKYKSKCFLEHE